MKLSMVPFEAGRLESFLSASVRQKRLGFSMVEVIAVLALLSILAGVVVPPMIAQIDHRVRQAESKQLEELAVGLREYIQGDLKMPDANSWKNDLAEQVGLSSADVAKNSRGLDRRFLIHPDFQGKLTGGQTTTGFTDSLSSAKLMILSSVYSGLPEAQDIVENETHFMGIWNTPGDEVPDRLSSDLGWMGTANDLMMEKIDLKSLFKEVIFQNVDGSDSIDYRIDGAEATLNAGVKAKCYFLKGTVIGFEDGGGAVVANEILQENGTFFYQDGDWYTSFPGDPGTDQWVVNYMAQMRDWIDRNNLSDVDVEDKSGNKFFLQGH